MARKLTAATEWKPTGFSLQFTGDYATYICGRCQRPLTRKRKITPNADFAAKREAAAERLACTPDYVTPNGNALCETCFLAMIREIKEIIQQAREHLAFLEAQDKGA